MIRVQVPATTANMGPGFDTLGMALNLWNIIEMEEGYDGLMIEVEGEGREIIPTDESNLVYQVALQVFRRVDYIPGGLSIKLINHIPVASGLGSSAAAIIGGLVAANKVAGNRLTDRELLNMATEIEGHPDNVAPALLGGIVVASVVEGEVKYIKINPPENMNCVLATPDFPLATKASRDVLPHTVTMTDAVFNISRTAVMVAALMAGDMAILGSVLDDKLHQPYRCALIPGMQQVFAAVTAAGAIGVALSGAGPTLIAFTDGQENQIVQIMKDTFKENGVDCQVLISKPNSTGACVMDLSKDTQKVGI